jgi:hypothetical protein
MRGKPYATLYLETHFKSNYRTDLQGRLSYNTMVGRQLDEFTNLWCLQRFRIGHTSFVREALGSMTPNHANLESNHNPRDYGVKRMGADEALNLA